MKDFSLNHITAKTLNELPTFQRKRERESKPRLNFPKDPDSDKIQQNNKMERTMITLTFRRTRTNNFDYRLFMDFSQNINFQIINLPSNNQTTGADLLLAFCYWSALQSFESELYMHMYQWNIIFPNFLQTMQWK